MHSIQVFCKLQVARAFSVLFLALGLEHGEKRLDICRMHAIRKTSLAVRCVKLREASLLGDGGHRSQSAALLAVALLISSSTC
jgi:hypothetical protein